MIVASGGVLVAVGVPVLPGGQDGALTRAGTPAVAAAWDAGWDTQSHAGDGVPVVETPPRVSGEPRSGQVLTCSTGAWTGSPTSYTFAWLRDGQALAGTNAGQYLLDGDDVAHRVGCRVAATNAHGTSAWSTSETVTVTGGPTAGPDPAPPASTPCHGKPTVVVDGGAAWTRQRQVSLEIWVPDEATAVELSADPDFDTYRRVPLSPSCRYPWTLGDVSSPVPQQVHVRFTGTEGYAVGSIRLDRLAPRITRLEARWSNRRRGWVLTLRAEDAGTGPAWFETAKIDRGHRRRYAWQRPVTSADSSVVALVRVADRLGNRTGWVQVLFLH